MITAKHQTINFIFSVIVFFSVNIAILSCQQNDENSSVYIPINSRNDFPWQILTTTGIVYKAQQNAVVSLYDIENLLREPSSDNRLTSYPLPNVQLQRKAIIYTDPEIDFEEPNKLRQHYNAEIVQLTLEQPIDTINSWGKNVTNGHLQEITTAQDIIGFKIIIFDVLYFSGRWQSKFNFNYQTNFYITPEKKIIVDVMEQTNYFHFLDSEMLGAKIVRLPCELQKLSMFILLPHAKDGANELLQNLNNDQIKRAQWMMEKTKLRIVIPKFKYSFNVNFKRDMLQHLIHSKIFRGTTSKHAFGEDVEKANIFQVTGIEVDDKGGESEDSEDNNSEQFVHFVVDRPFVFFVEEETTGTIVCLGKIVNPSIN